MRLEYHTDGDLLFHAFKSQLKLNSNSYNTLTYSKFTKEVFQELGFPTIPIIKSNTMKRTCNIWSHRSWTIVENITSIGLNTN